MNLFYFITAFFLWVTFLVFTHSLKRKKDFLVKVILFTVGFFFQWLVMLVWGNTFSSIKIFYAIWMLVYLSITAFTCYEINRGSALYVSIWSLISSQFIFQIWLLCRTYFDIESIQWIYTPVVLCFWYILILFVFLKTITETMPQNGKYRIGPRQLISAIALMLIFELIYVLIVYSELIYSRIFLFPGILSQIYGIFTLYIQTELFKKSAVEQELSSISMLWEQQKQQYDLKKENIDLINQKCHDIKHQISIMRKMANNEGLKKYLIEMEKSVLIYESIVRTGNEVLDIILTEKSLYCEANGIQIHNVVDGRRMDFFDPIDLFTILGNAIDNAIESVKNIENPDLRLIDLAIYRKDQFLMITISNPILEEVTFEEGIPVSTKSQNGFHGYGIRSIKHYISKYNGHMNISVENGCFILKMLIPIVQYAI